MYVRKFEADTIEDALKDIKRELGPDAIILKTISNKGLKGAFKKKKIEITAAISEKTYTKKANVDAVLNPEEKSEFYQGSSSYISNMIDRMDNGREKMNASQKNKYSSSYGDMSLNRNVKVDRSEKIDKAISKMTHGGLEQFLSVDEEPKVDKNFSLNQSLSSFDFDNENEKLNHNHFLKKSQSQNSSKDIQGKKINRYIDQEDDQFDDHNEELENAYGRSDTQGDLGYSFQSNNQASQQEIIELSENFKEYAEMQKAKIESLEKKLYEMTKVVHKFQKPEANGIFQLRQLLRSHGVHNEYVTKIIKKATFELSESELDNSEVVLEFAFREMQNAIHVALPKFAKTLTAPSVTIFLSESMTGQSSLIKKICAVKSDCVIINNSKNESKTNENFTDKVFNIPVISVNGISEIVAECRKAIEKGCSVFVDYNCRDSGGSVDEENSKKFVDGMKRSFQNVEVLITLSSIHSELYNKKVLAKYKRISDGISLNHLDECLNFGSIFNLSEEYPELPMVFYGTGRVIPDDLESASKEKIIAGLFKL